MGLTPSQQVTGFIPLNELVFLPQAPVGGGCFTLLTTHDLCLVAFQRW